MKFLEHFALISEALETQGLWDEEDGFFYDRLQLPGRLDAVPVKVRSMVGILPLLGVAAVDEAVGRARADASNKRARELLDRRRRDRTPQEEGALERRRPRELLARRRRPRARPAAVRAALRRGRVPLAVRAARASRATTPSTRSRSTLDGTHSTIDYEPAESTTGMFGGNSNWRGPIWMPVNYLVVNALARYARFLGDDVTIEYPTGSGEQHDARARSPTTSASG